LLILPRPPISSLFPSPTLFRSPVRLAQLFGGLAQDRDVVKGVDRADDAIVLVAQKIDVNHDHDARAVGALHQHLFTPERPALAQDRKSTRLNSSHVKISYAVFC